MSHWGLLLLSVLGAQAWADDIKITNSKLVFNGFSYFRGKAEAVDLASFGEKKAPVTGMNYLAKESNVARDNLGKVKVDISGPYTIDWSHYSDTDVNASVDTKACSGSKSTVDVPPNTTFAYGLHKVKKWSSGKTKVEDMEDDQSGLN